MTSIDIFGFETRSSMEERGRSCGLRFVLLGEGAEAPRKFFVIRVSLSESEQSGLEIGLISSGIGSKPAWKYDQSNNAIAIGHDDLIDTVNIETGSTKPVRLDGVFFEFANVQDGILVAIHELGATRISFGGAVLWSFSTSDTVSDWKVENDSIRFMLSDGSSKTVAIASGKPR